MTLFLQAAWAAALLFATWCCYEGSHKDPTRMRLIAFLAIFIGVLHGAHELNQLAEVVSGYPLDRATGYEVLLPLLLALFKYFPVVRHKVPHG